MQKMNTRKSSNKLGGSKFNKTEQVQLRLDKIQRFTANMCALTQKRTLTGFIENAIEKSAHEVKIGHLVSDFSLFQPNEIENLTVPIFVKRVWDIDPAVRFIRMAQTAPLLLSADEELIWEAIRLDPRFWTRSETLPEKRTPNIRLIRLMWDELQIVENEGLDSKSIKDKIFSLAKEDGAATQDLVEFEKIYDKLFPHSDLI